MKKAFIIIAILFLSLAYIGMANQMSDELKDVYGGAIVPMEGGDDFENPPATVGSVSLSGKPRPLQMGSEVQKGLLGGQPVFHLHDNIYQEGFPHGKDVGLNFTFAAGNNDFILANAFSDAVPLDLAFRILKIEEVVAIDPGLANLSNLFFDYFIIKDHTPLYRGFVRHPLIPNNGAGLINTLYSFTKDIIDFDVWIPQESRISIMARIIGAASVGGTAAIRAVIGIKGYLAAPPYPLGKGQNLQVPGIPSVALYSKIFNTYGNF